MPYITLSLDAEGHDMVETHERRPSWVVIENASIMLRVDLEKSSTDSIYSDIRELAKALEIK
jgi:hypothetical protein